VELQYAFIAYLFSRQLPATEDFDISTFYYGMMYLINGILVETMGQPILKTVPKIFNDIIAALKPKTVKYRNGEISYSWNAPAISNQFSFNMPWGVLQPLIPVEGATYNTLCDILVPIPDTGLAEYTTLLGYIQGIDDLKKWWLKTVEDSTKSILIKDASTFARTYAYSENPNSVGSVYNDVELETKNFNPTLSHFCPYNSNKRYPSKGCIELNSNSSSGCLNPLLDVEQGWFNKIPVQFTFLDFYDLTNRILYWYIKCVEANIQGTPTPFEFSYQDWLLMMRQGIIAQFRDQWNVMLMDPTQYNNAYSNFIPFVIQANNYPLNYFQRTLIPILIAENIAAVQAKRLKFSDSKVNAQVVVPVLGYYNEDTPIDWFYSDGVTPVFTTFAPPQQPIDLALCTTGTNAYVNVNCMYYKEVCDDWNEAVNSIKEVSSTITPLSQIKPSAMPLCFYQRTVGTIPEGKIKVRKPCFGKDFSCTKYVRNAHHKVPREITRTTSQKELQVKSIPPTNQDALIYVSQYSAFPVNADLQSILNFLWVPSIRLDPDSFTPFTLNDFRIIEQLPFSYPICTPMDTSPSWLAIQQSSGELSYTGVAKEDGSTFDTVFKALTASGHAGILAGLLGGFVKSILPPEAAGVVDAIGNFLP
jgi:hypothetical protein